MKPEFDTALVQIIAEDPRYAGDAYSFLCDALKYTVKQRKKAKEASHHVSGQQLLEGIRAYALKQFGPMVPTVFEYWGIRRCEDFGAMVFNMISVGLFGKTDSDSIDDFKAIYNFHDAFIAPYLPAPGAVHRRLLLDRPAAELR